MTMYRNQVFILFICLCLLSCSSNIKSNESPQSVANIPNIQAKVDVDETYIKLIAKEKKKYLSLSSELEQNLAKQTNGSFFSNISLKSKERHIRERLEYSNSSLQSLIELYESTKRLNRLLEGNTPDTYSQSLSKENDKAANMCIKFKKSIGWSKGYTVVGNIISGSELSYSTGNYGKFDILATYAVVFWDDDEASIFKLPVTSFGKLPMFESEVEDQKGAKWKIKKYNYLCY